ncbi:SDR family NAD(P)-dependent oxidoreductase [Acuticoccus mangrovi]|uniref:SDR family oxidoreductase n=1 Tax=Acuticoccus mangrovi TaxID=2796142 RepID=A0A934MFT6_9HYPH|nr:SDR family oxidoreductase [Acuticoccus mangrovi]
MRGLDGKVAIVTGGARGIGRAIAERLCAEGSKVMIADLDAAAGQKVARAIGSEDCIRATECDVAEKLDVRNLLAATRDAFGPIDVLVNNAGIVGGAEFLDLKEDDFDRVMAVNLKGAFILSQAVARHMVERVKAGETPGAIVNMSSVNAVFALPTQVAYSISKAGISQLTRVAALSLAPYGIRVNAVGPGSIMTDMLASVNKDAEARRVVMSRTPMRRIGAPEEIASIVAFLASEEASYMTGQTVFADGGRLPLNYTVPTEA